MVGSKQKTLARKHSCVQIELVDASTIAKVKHVLVASVWHAFKCGNEPINVESTSAYREGSSILSSVEFSMGVP